MLGELGTVIRPLLALLLVVLTPIGTGEGVHRDQLLDPLFPHMHLDASAETGTPATTHAAAATGVAIGGGAGAADSIAPGLTPPVPSWLVLFPRAEAPWHYPILGDPVTVRPDEPPPDPPPDLG
jgi:hypothetical protein